MNELYKKKYLKYKQKYLLLKGGAGTFYLYINGIAEYVDGSDIWNNHIKKRILDKILPHFTQIEIRYYDPLFYGEREMSAIEVQEYRELIERPTPQATVNTYFQENMPPLDTLPPILNKNNHLILNFANLEYNNMYDRFNILYLGYLSSDSPLFLHIPYLTILSDEQVRSQSTGVAKQIILFNDQLINHNYVSSNVGSWYFITYFYEQLKENYKRYIDGVLRASADVLTRQTIIQIIDSIFENSNFLIKLYLIIYRMTSTIYQPPLGDRIDNKPAVEEMLKQNLDAIFRRIDFSKLNQFNLPKTKVVLPPEPLPPFLNIDSLVSTYSDINPEVLKLLCPYIMPVSTTTPDRFLSLLVSPVY